MNYKELDFATLNSVIGGSDNLLKDTLYQVAAAAGVLYANRKNMAKGFKDGVKEEDGFKQL